MLGRIRLSRNSSGNWKNSTPVKSDAGVPYTLNIDKYYDGASILDQYGNTLASTSTASPLPNLLQAIKNYLSSTLGVTVAMLTKPDTEGVSLIVPTPVVHTMTFSAAPASGSYELTHSGASTALIQWNATASQIQAALRLLPGLQSTTVASVSSTVFHINTFGLAVPTIGSSTNTLMTSAPAAVTIAFS